MELRLWLDGNGITTHSQMITQAPENDGAVATTLGSVAVKIKRQPGCARPTVIRALTGGDKLVEDESAEEWSRWTAPLVSRTTLTECAHDFPLTLLKSALHRCVRLGRAMDAVITASQVIRQRGLFQLARHLCIIIMEDAVLHPDTPYLVWLMCVTVSSVTSRFDAHTTAAHIHRLLCIVWGTASCDIKDNLTDDDYDTYARQAITLHDSLQELTSTERDLVRALMIRSSVGGIMQTDKRMCCVYASVWRARFTSANRARWHRLFRTAYPAMSGLELLQTFVTSRH